MEKNVVDGEKPPATYIEATHEGKRKRYWEANPDKSKRYGDWTPRRKELTIRDAMKMLGVTDDWLAIFVAGEKGYRKLAYEWDGKDIRSMKFRTSDVYSYRLYLRARNFSVKTRRAN